MDKSNTNLIDILQMHIDAGVDESIINEPEHLKVQDIMKTNTVVTNKSDSDIMPPNEAYVNARQIVDGINDLGDLCAALKEFKGCSLYKTATNMVFAEGAENAKVMFIGEAPGANEDVEGVPFCGDSGKLLNKVIASIGLSREKNAYITNAVFWRPPGNRRPTDEELKICRPFVEKHIALINPKIIVMVGSTASNALFGDLGPVSKQRQQIFEYDNQYLDNKIKSIVTFHPSYLLRQPSQKRAAWRDMLFIKDQLS